MTDEEKKEMKRIRDNYKKEAKETTDAVLLSAACRDEDDFKSWKDDALDWSWDSIMKG